MLASAQNGPNADDQDELLTRYTLTSRADILFQLRALLKRKLLVNLEIHGTRQLVVTSVLAVNENNNTVILDISRNEGLNQELLSGKEAQFLAQLDGVSLSFNTGPVGLCTYESLPALRIVIPTSMIRLQRREDFRVHMPIANPVKCIITKPGNGETDPITTHIVDISCGGAAIVDTSSRLRSEPGQILAECQLLLSETDRVVTTLEVRNTAQVSLPNGTVQRRLGCRFVDLPKDMAAKLQRFVMEIERARRNSL